MASALALQQSSTNWAMKTHTLGAAQNIELVHLNPRKEWNFMYALQKQRTLSGPSTYIWNLHIVSVFDWLSL